MAVVVSHGVLFRGGVEAAIRRRLLDKDMIEGVIGLCPRLLERGRINAALLLLNKNKVPSRRGKVVVVDGASEFASGGPARSLSSSNIERLSRAYLDFTSEPGFSLVISHADIEKRGHVLLPGNYIRSAALELGAEVRKP
jgi:type I restriction enzyme M protein